MSVEAPENPQIRHRELHIFDSAIRAVDAFHGKVESHGTFARETIESDGRSYVGSLTPIVADIRNIEVQLEKEREEDKSNNVPSEIIAENVREEMEEIRTALKDMPVKRLKEELDGYLPEVFARFGEAVRDTLGFDEIHDFQLRDAIAMHDGKVAELPPGRGKTVAIGHAASLNALAGKGVHVITANDYLARHDAHLLGEAYYKLGIKVAVILSRDNTEEDAQYEYDPNYPGDDPDFPHLKRISRVDAYKADVTYGIDHSFMIDALIDEKPENILVEAIQRLYIAFVDEADDGLVDEAEVPHIIGRYETITEKKRDMLKACSRIAEQLEVDELDENGNLVNASTADLAVDTEKGWLEAKFLPTEQGAEKIWQLLIQNNLVKPGSKSSSYDDLFDGKHNDLILALDNAFRAQHAYVENVDYLKVEGKIILINKPKGRQLLNNRLTNGLHQAIEAKEGVEILPDMITINAISVPEYFRRYSRIGATTGTAVEAADIFYRLYKMDVVQILPPTNPNLVHEATDGIFTGKEGPVGLFAKAVDSAVRKHATGRPVIIFAQSVEDADSIGARLKQALGSEESKIVNILHARQTAQEARIIAQAGKFGALTVVTQMAGRGTDIIPGGELIIPTFPEWQAQQARGGLRLLLPAEETYRQEVERLKAEHERVNLLGGPHVILTGEDDKKRLERQKVGRTGRQNGPGSYEKLISWDDAVFDSLKLETKTRKQLLREYGLLLTQKTRAEREAIIHSRKYQAKLEALMESLQQKNAQSQTDTLVRLSETQDIVAEVRRAYLESLKGLSKGTKVDDFIQKSISDTITMLMTYPSIIEEPEDSEAEIPESFAAERPITKEASSDLEPEHEDFGLAALERFFRFGFSNEELGDLSRLSPQELHQELYILAMQKLFQTGKLSIHGTNFENYFLVSNFLTRSWQDFIEALPTQVSSTALSEGINPGTFSTRLRKNAQHLLSAIAQDMELGVVGQLFAPTVKIRFVIPPAEPTSTQQHSIESLQPNDRQINIIMMSPFGNLSLNSSDNSES